MFNTNKEIGRFDLIDIPPAPRGIPQIEVTFDIDANGILNVSAKNKETGKEQSIRIEASSGLNQKEIEKMKKEAQENAEKDKKTKEEIDKLNAADALIFQTEKQLKDYSDKLSEEKKKKIENILNDCKMAYKEKQIIEIERTTKLLNEAWAEASQDLYTQNSSKSSEESSKSSEDSSKVQDVDFEEVK